MCVFTQKMVTFTLRVSIKVYVCMNSGGLNITALLGDLFTLTMYFCDLCNLPFNIINLLHWKYASPVRPLWLERVDFKYKVKGRLVKIRVRDEKKTYNVSPTGVKITSFAKSLHTTLFTWMIDSVQSHNQTILVDEICRLVCPEGNASSDRGSSLLHTSGKTSVTSGSRHHPVER